MTDLKHPRHVAIEQALGGARQRLPQLPYEQVLTARLMTHAHKQAQQLSNSLLKRHQLNYVTYATLMVLYGAGPAGINASELAKATGEKSTNLTRICDELLQRDLIEREPSANDRRCIMLRLSRAGETLIESVQPEVWELVNRLYAGFSERELQQMQNFLGRLLAAGLGETP